MNTDRKKILAVASWGGHWQQLKRVLTAFEGHEIVLVATHPDARNVAASFACHIIPDANLHQKTQALWQGLKVLRIVLCVRPDIVVSTGASCGFFALFFGKLCGARTIWVDSLANVKQLSLSGRVVRPFADLWLTQWPELARPGGPHFKGSLL
jgi:UDP-N-acetylglucosamine:LPS N-acetylglucosamine transferase